MMANRKQTSKSSSEVHRTKTNPIFASEQCSPLICPHTNTLTMSHTRVLYVQPWWICLKWDPDRLFAVEADSHHCRLPIISPPLFISSPPLADYRSLSLCLLLTNGRSYAINSIPNTPSPPFSPLPFLPTYRHLFIFLSYLSLTSFSFSRYHIWPLLCSTQGARRVRCAMKRDWEYVSAQREGKRKGGPAWDVHWPSRRIFLSQCCQRAGSAVQMQTHKQYRHTCGTCRCDRGNVKKKKSRSETEIDKKQKKKKKTLCLKMCSVVPVRDRQHAARDKKSARLKRLMPVSKHFPLCGSVQPPLRQL